MVAPGCSSSLSAKSELVTQIFSQMLSKHFLHQAWLVAYLLARQACIYRCTVLILLICQVQQQPFLFVGGTFASGLHNCHTKLMFVHCKHSKH